MDRRLVVLLAVAGGAIGSALGAAAWSAGGWGSVCLCGGAIAGLAAAFWLTELWPGRVPARELAQEPGC